MTHALLQSSIESLKDTLIFSVDHNYRYLIFNSAFREATAHAYGTVVARGVSMLDTITDEGERKKAKKNCDRALQGESHTTVEKYGVLTPSYFETQYNPITGNDGILGVSVVSRNITEQKVAEEAVAALNRDLEAFSYSVAHDLRAPLRVINAYSEILIEEHTAQLDDESQRMLKLISGNVTRMSELIDGLLTFAKMGQSSLNRTSTDVRAMIQRIVADHMATPGSRHAQVRLGQIENAYGDSKLLYHVFANLISNALKYSAKREAPVVEISSWKEDNAVTYSIRDNGAGFDMKYGNKLFGVFQRLHDESEFHGTGIGLAIAHRVISRHGGKIWGEGKVDEGATFFFTLPLPEK